MRRKSSKEKYDALVQEALRKLNAAYEKLPARPAEREIREKIRLASDEQLERIKEILDGSGYT